MMTILKSQLTTKFTTPHNCRADFLEWLPTAKWSDVSTRAYQRCFILTLKQIMSILDMIVKPENT